MTEQSDMRDIKKVKRCLNDIDHNIMLKKGIFVCYTCGYSVVYG